MTTTPRHTPAPHRQGLPLCTRLRISSFPSALLCLLGWTLLLPLQMARAERNVDVQDFLGMSIEDLMNVTVTSMSKREQSLHDTAGAVYVLTSQDIERSGATCVPEVLRMVPGLMVAQNNAGVWSVSSRGRSFNPIFENKLLVLIDGRSVYTPFYSGVFWETLDVMLEDIERIEVIRGPGNSAWGSNAVNGIINIISKKSADTQGFLGTVQYGTRDLGAVAMRYGNSFGEANTYRVYAKYHHLGELETMDGDNVPGETGLLTTGFKTELVPDDQSALTLQGDMTIGDTDMSLAYPDMALPVPAMTTLSKTTDALLANMLGKYTRDLGNDSSIQFQTYVSRDRRGNDLWLISFDTLDLDFQHQFSPLENHIAQWGLGYRLVTISTNDYEDAFLFEPSATTQNLYSAFVQDEISFLDGTWLLTLGSKFEHNDQTGLEIMPSARLLWHVNDTHSLWTAVSRAVRTPSMVEQAATYNIDGGVLPIEFPPGSGMLTYVPYRFSMIGSDNVDAEDIVTYELGYRYAPSTKFSLDASLFYAQADNLMSAGGADVTLPSMTQPFVQVDTDINNDESADIYGLELTATWQVLDWWRLNGWYAHYEDDCHYDGPEPDNFAAMYGALSPRHQFFLRSSMDLPHATTLDVLGRYVSEIPGLGVPDYGTFDVRLSWKISEHADIALVGQNLLEPRHEEASTSIVYGASGAVSRSCYLKLMYTF